MRDLVVPSCPPAAVAAGQPDAPCAPARPTSHL